MNKQEAASILEQEIRQLRRQPYSRFRDWIEQKKYDTKRHKAQSGKEYQISYQALYDDKKAETIRVMVDVDDGTGISSFVPMSSDFIIAPNGSFVGED